jgi:L-lactate dehydrogenase
LLSEALFCVKINNMSINNEIQPLELKISVIGAGAVGAAVAYTLVARDIGGEIVLIDINKDKQDGEVLDIRDGLSFSKVGKITGGDYSDAADSDIVIMTAGTAQKPGETRLDLAGRNKGIAKSIFAEVGQLKPNCIVIVVANPVDVITRVIQDTCNLPKNQVFGTGTCLDSARLRSRVAGQLGIDGEQVDGYVLGEHGNSEFVAWSTISVGGKPVSELLSNEDMSKIAEDVKNEVYEIIKRKGATYFGIAMTVSDIVEAVIHDQNRILPVSSRLNNWNDVDDVCISAPAIIGRSGVVRLWDIELPEVERAKMCESAVTVTKYVV